MAESTGRGATGQLPVKVEAVQVEATNSNWAYTRVTRRQWTLIAVTGLLNVLFLCSLLCIIVQIYQAASDPDDSTNVASEILMFISALATLAYIILHSIFSLKQRIWRHQGRLPAKDKKTSYIAVRFGGTLCMLWLLTNGWNMILVARRPICLPEAADVNSWEIGETCQVGRVGIAFAMIALVASCALFGMLATVSRPFEAHLLNYKHTPHVHTPTITPSVSPRQPRSRSISTASNRFNRSRVSFSTYRSTQSHVSNADVDTLDLNSTSASESIAAPAPIRSLGTGVFTSHAQPPPVPAAYATPSRNSSSGLPPPFFQPSLSTSHLPLPPRMSTLASSRAFVPMSIPAQYAASNWRAVHPSAPSPLAIAASRSHSHLPLADSSQRFSYRVRYARSSISLTRPHRLSTSTPADSVGWSSRSSSASPDKGHDSNDEAERMATAGQIAYALLNGTNIPGTSGAQSKHSRHASAPDATAGAQMPRRTVKTQTQTQMQTAAKQEKTLVKSSSATLLRVHSTDKNAKTQRDTDLKSSIDEFVTMRKLHSERPPVPAKPIVKAKAPANPAIQHHVTSNTKRGSADPSIAAMLRSLDKENMPVKFEEVKNKPLPRITAFGSGKGLEDRRGVYNR